MKRLSLLAFALLVTTACGQKKESAGSTQAGSAQAGSAHANSPPSSGSAVGGSAAGSAQAAGSASAVKLPGTCVDPVTDAARRLKELDAATGGAPDEPPVAAPAPDVDGDGTADTMFAAGLGVTTNTLLYVMRGSCGHYVGDIGSPPEPPKDATRSNGLLDLRSLEVGNCEGARCGCEPGETVHRFDGTEYRLDEKASRQSVEKPCE